MPQDDKPLTIFMSAAEASGDEHASKLILKLKERLGPVRFVGVAGPRMAAAGCEVLADVTHKASMLGGPILNLVYYIRRIRRIQAAIRRLRPDIVVPVDSPAMNWHIAKAAKGIGVPVVYYVSPQVWAWAPWRVKKLARLTDRVACILPFEQEYLRQRGVNATFVGHPIYDDCPPRPQPLPDLYDAWYSGRWRVALLPGSRPAEIKHHTPAMLQVAAAIARRWPDTQCTFATLSEGGAAEIRRIAQRKRHVDVEVIVGPEAAQQVLAQSNFAVVGSGTVTLQVAYYGVPMVIFYRAGLLTRLLHQTVGRLKSVVPTRSFSLVNILAQRRIVPEMMPWYGDVNALTRVTLEAMHDLGYLLEMRRNILSVTQPLLTASHTAAGNAADLVIETLERAKKAAGGSSPTHRLS